MFMFKPVSSVSQCRTGSSSNMNLWVPNFKLSITKNGLQYNVPNFKLSITRNGLQYNVAVIYNMLPPDIK